MASSWAYTNDRPKSVGKKNKATNEALQFFNFLFHVHEAVDIVVL